LRTKKQILSSNGMEVNRKVYVEEPNMAGAALH
jgi:hypothetical protein